jgi:hypothetical protein
MKKLGQRAISILRCAAQENLRLKYRKPDRRDCLLIVAKEDDKDFFIRLLNLIFLSYFCEPVNKYV